MIAWFCLHAKKPKILVYITQTFANDVDVKCCYSPRFTLFHFIFSFSFILLMDFLIPKQVLNFWHCSWKKGGGRSCKYIQHIFDGKNSFICNIRMPFRWNCTRNFIIDFQFNENFSVFWLINGIWCDDATTNCFENGIDRNVKSEGSLWGHITVTTKFSKEIIGNHFSNII